ncbi:MAG: hypothetical protein HZC11_08735 [Nitrospirae bacterium]|nr:hypothetical protein [Nitrospirota bacterium]
MNVSVKLPEKIKDEIISITEKSNVVDGIKDLVKQELIRKKTKYLFMVRNFEKKYGTKFKEFEQKIKNKKMDYETEKDYFEWDMALTALEDIKEEIKGV